MKKAILILAMVAMLFTLCAGCTDEPAASTSSGSSSPTSSGGASSGEEISLKIWDFSNNEPLMEAVANYELENSHIQITVEDFPGADQPVGSLQTAIGAGTNPDIAFCPDNYIMTMGSRGYIYDLAEFGAADVKDQFIESIWNVTNPDKNGKIWGLPFYAYVMNFTYNQDIFDAVGVSVPKTRAEVQNVAQKIKAKYGNNTGVSALGYPFEEDPYVMPVRSFVFRYNLVMWRFGADVFNEDLTECTINSPAAVEALEYMASLKTDGLVTAKYDEGQFTAGNVGMLEDTCCGFFIKMAASTANLRMALMPVLKEGVDPYTGMGLYAYHVVKPSKNPQAAYDFIKYYTTNVEYITNYCKPQFLVPPLKAAWEQSYFQTDDWKVIREQLNYAKSMPGIEGYADMEQIISDAMEEVFQGKRTAKEALDAAKEQIDRLLKK